MPLARANGIDLAYEVKGDPSAPPVLLIMGLGMPLALWPDAFVDGLVASGFRVVLFDNRDVGLSRRIESADLGNALWAIGKAFMGFPVHGVYTIDDMADDAAGLLEALAIPKAHVVGMSMGGMIAQAMAARHAPRVASLTSIMSTSGSPRVSMGNPRALRAVLQLPPNPKDLEAVARHLEHVLRTIGSERYPPDEAELKAVCKRVAERGLDPQGSSHQLFAILASGDRRASLKRINAPTLVIHGVDDPLLPVEGSRDIAENIAGAELWEVEGMAHDLPGPLIPALVVRIAAHCRRVPWDQSPAPKPAAGP
ncbi:MAG: alpha/beta fold hydrolase [Betaproteobacteria bacterium]|nr:alpha/beta fold hydrolase [Betaproteobacteria bacterium]